MRKKYFFYPIFYILFPFYLIILISVAFYLRYFEKKHTRKRLVWGSTPIINNKYYSNSLREIGYTSETYTIDFYNNINNRQDWDRIVYEEFPLVPRYFKPFLAFLFALFKYDVFFISFDGFFIGNTPARFIQSWIFKIARKKVVVIPYGSDAYVYRNISSIYTIHGLMMSYPEASKKQNYIFKNVNYWCNNADCVLAGIMGPDGIGRWDVLLPSILMIDAEKDWKKSIRKNLSDGSNDEIVIAHAPNHRGYKGTEFIIDAVQKLKQEGYKIKLILIENLQNQQVKKILNEDVDILVEQLVATGHGINALEGMASGLPVVSNLEDNTYIMPFRRWSYFNECPIVSATPENIKDVLKSLITRPELRSSLGAAGWEYVQKYHSFQASQYLFTNVIDFVYGRKKSIINLFHPLLGEKNIKFKKIEHPLIENKII